MGISSRFQRAKGPRRHAPTQATVAPEVEGFLALVRDTLDGETAWQRAEKHAPQRQVHYHALDLAARAKVVALVIGTDPLTPARVADMEPRLRQQLAEYGLDDGLREGSAA